MAGPSKYIIVGLPRSRTAWLANLFCYGSSFCLHDGLAAGSDFFLRLRGIAAANPSIRHVGNADSGIPLFMAPEEFADCKVLVVLRDREECAASFRKYFSDRPYPNLPFNYDGHEKYFEMVSRRLKDFYRAIPSHRKYLVCYHHLDNIELVAQVWNFLVPDEVFNPFRYEVLNNMRINTASEKVHWRNTAKPLAIA